MITLLRHPAPGVARDRVLLVMLPGVGIPAGAFAAQGMVAAAQGQGVAVDVVAAQPALELYLDGGIAAALRRVVVEPALAQGYARVWLLGISMGGMGALLYAASYPAEVAGLVLLAPFLGTRGTVAELARAGGLAGWSAARSAATAPERRLLLWLQETLARQPAVPAFYLGFGTEDRFAPGHRLLAAGLPAERVVTTPGGHDWDTWLALWRRLLDLAPFSSLSGNDV